MTCVSFDGPGPEEVPCDPPGLPRCGRRLPGRQVAKMNEEHYERVAIRAQRLVRDGQLKEAEEILNELPPGEGFSGWLHEKVLASLMIASAQLEAGETDAGKNSLEALEIEVKALEPGSVWEAADCYLQMAKMLAHRSDVVAADRLCESAVDLASKCERRDVDCRKILYQAARCFAELGNLEKAKSTALHISYEPLRRRAFDVLGIEIAEE